MGELEAVGEAVTGGMIGRAVEPDAGEAGPTATRTKNAASTAARRWPATIATLAAKRPTSTARCVHSGHDLLHGVLHFEGKIWRTLPLLAWRPGELTRRYIDGERAQVRLAGRAVPVHRLPDVRGAEPDRGARHGGTGETLETRLASRDVRERGQAIWSSSRRRRARRSACATRVAAIDRKIDERLSEARTELTASASRR